MLKHFFSRVTYLAIMLLLSLFLNLFLSAQLWSETESFLDKNIPSIDRQEQLATQKMPSKEKKEEPVVITSDTLVADDKNNTATFIGSVKAVRGEAILYADKMVAIYTEDEGKIVKITATGNVKLVKGKRIITSDNAEYFAEKEEVIFTGTPEAIEEKSTITGTKMVYHITEERFIVENSRVHLIESD